MARETESGFWVGTLEGNNIERNGESPGRGRHSNLQRSLKMFPTPTTERQKPIVNWKGTDNRHSRLTVAIQKHVSDTQANDNRDRGT